MRSTRLRRLPWTSLDMLHRILQHNGNAREKDLKSIRPQKFLSGWPQILEKTYLLAQSFDVYFVTKPLLSPAQCHSTTFSDFMKALIGQHNSNLSRKSPPDFHP